jgi:hypothetical protein
MRVEIRVTDHTTDIETVRDVVDMPVVLQQENLNLGAVRAAVAPTIPEPFKVELLCREHETQLRLVTPRATAALVLPAARFNFPQMANTLPQLVRALMGDAVRPAKAPGAGDLRERCYAQLRVRTVSVTLGDTERTLLEDTLAFDGLYGTPFSDQEVRGALEGLLGARGVTVDIGHLPPARVAGVRIAVELETPPRRATLDLEGRNTPIAGLRPVLETLADAIRA